MPSQLPDPRRIDDRPNAAMEVGEFGSWWPLLDGIPVEVPISKDIKGWVLRGTIQDDTGYVCEGRGRWIQASSQAADTKIFRWYGIMGVIWRPRFYMPFPKPHMEG
jgi:hypothetical protein